MNKETEAINIGEWWPLFIFFTCLFMMLETLLGAISLAKMDQNMIYCFLVELLILTLISFFLYYKIEKQTRINGLMSKQLIKKEYQEKIYNLVNRTIDHQNEEKHLMQYSFLNIKNLLENKDYDQVNLFVNNELHKYLNYRFIASSNNPLFDYELTIKVNELTSQKKDVKTILLIDKYNSILDDDTLISYIMNCIDSYNISDKIEFLFKEIDNYILFKIILSKPTRMKIVRPENNHHKLRKFNYIDEEYTVNISFLFANKE